IRKTRAANADRAGSIRLEDRSIAPRSSARKGSSVMLKFTDDQISVIESYARPLHVNQRSEFLQSVAELLNGHDEIGDGTIARACAEVQRRYLRPTDLRAGQGKHSRG